MTYPHDDILSADSTRNRAVLLSERTQLILLKVLQSGENQSAWDDTTDAEWDDIDEAIGEAEYEILTEDNPPLMAAQVLYASRASNQAISANTDTAIIWTGGNYNVSNPTRLYVPQDGMIVVQCAVNLTSAIASTAQCWIQFSDGSRHSLDDADASRLSHFFNQVWIYGQAIDSNYVEVYVRMTQAGNAAVATTPPYFS